MKIAVITDSGTGWSEEQAKEKGLFYLPLQVKCGDEEFLDGIDITVSELYERLRNGEMPTTSMPPLGRVEALFAQLKEEGYEYVIAVPLSAGISSTASMIEAAAKRAELPISVIDPYTTVNTQGYLAVCARELAEQGVEPQEIERRLKASVESGNTLLVPDDLMHLKRGGRLTPLAATLGSMLKIKPILQINEHTKGKIDVAGKVRTMSKAMDTVIERMKQAGVDRRYSVTVAHADAPEAAEVYRRKIEAAIEGVQVNVIKLVSVVGVHTGRGCQALQYFCPLSEE